MALIICPECGHQVSDKAETCPSCGIKIAGNVVPLQPQQPQYVQQAHQSVQPQQQAVQPLQEAAQQMGGSTPTPQPKKKSYGTLIVSFLIALCIVGVGFYFYSDKQQEREMEDYEAAMLSNDPMVMQNYLLRYGDAPQEHKDSINARMMLLTQQDNDWTNAVVTGTKTALLDYIKSHPDSPHSGEAMNKIDSIDYAIASRANTTEAYKKYLEEHPDGKYATNAQGFLDEKKSTEVQPEELDIAKTACKHFLQAINAHSESKLLATVTDYLGSFLNRTNASSSDVVNFMNRLYKEDVTNLNFHMLDDFKAEKVKNNDGEFNIKVQFGTELTIDRTDDSKEKFAKYIISAEVTPDGRITNLNMKKQSLQ